MEKLNSSVQLSTMTILFSAPKGSHCAWIWFLTVLLRVFQLVLHVYVSINNMQYCFAYFLILSENFVVHFIHWNTCCWNFSMLVYVTQCVIVWLGTQNDSRYSKQKGIWYTELETSSAIGRLRGTKAKGAVSDHLSAGTRLCMHLGGSWRQRCLLPRIKRLLSRAGKWTSSICHCRIRTLSSFHYKFMQMHPTGRLTKNHMAMA